jgi:hypothetical protein
VRASSFSRAHRARRAADDLHHLVEVGHRDDQAEQDVGALAGLQQLELRAPGDHFLAELDEALDDVAKGQRLGPAAADRQHVGREARLRRSVPPQLVQHTSGVASRFRSMTIRTPSRFDSSRMSATPSIRLSLAASAIFSTSPDLPTWIRDFGEHDRAAGRPCLPRPCSAIAS